MNLRETKSIITLAVPLVIGQLGQMLLGVFDTIMVGKVGVLDLAALSFANLLKEQVAHSVTNQDCDCFPSLNALTDLSVYLSMLCICLSIQ